MRTDDLRRKSFVPQPHERPEDRLPPPDLFFQLPQIDVARSLRFFMVVAYRCDMGQGFSGGNVCGVSQGNHPPSHISGKARGQMGELAGKVLVQKQDIHVFFGVLRFS
jgi:hypothetical protein